MTETSTPCPDPGAKRPLSAAAALERLLDRIVPVSETETVPLGLALGRVLAEPLRSPIAVPSWDNSAMDGYALRAADLGAGPIRLPVSQRIPAGSAALPLAPGTAARIFTGAPVPAGADTVVIQEHCLREGDWVEIPSDIRLGSNIRRAGEDIQVGDRVMAGGTRLGPQHLGLAASLGLADLAVFRRLRVAMLATGDELVMPGAPLGPGEIYDSNRFALAALLERLGCQVLDLGRVPDRLDATIEALGRGASAADLIVGSGGVSVGEEDHVRAALERLGTVELWNVAIRPGKPLVFGHIGNTPFLGNPGNPVSLFVTFCLFARPLALRMQGVAGELAPLGYRVRSGFDWAHPDRRREFHRARVRMGSDGDPEALAYPSRSAAAISSLVWADGLVEIPEGQAIRRGDPVTFIPFDTLLH